MNKKIFLPALWILFSSFVLTGCFGVNGEFREIRNLIIGDFGGEFQKTTEFSVGSATIGFFAGLAAIDDNDENIEELLENIREVQIGIYECSDNGKPVRTTCLKICRKMAKNGWKHFIRTIENNEMTLLFIPETSGEAIERMFVIAKSSDELVLMELSGNIEKILSAAIKEKGENLKLL